LGAESQRLFFALDPDPETRNRLVRAQRSLDLSGRRVPAANIHMTLAFLGNVPVSQLGDLCALAADLDFPPGEITLDRAGSFRKSRVGWLGCSEPPRGLETFQGMLVNALSDNGFHPDARAWKPHVTLYRDLRKPFDTIPVKPVRWRLSEFCLMHSGQCPKGVLYTAIGRWPG
jgi:2'-5' RNA ligase